MVEIPKSGGIKKKKKPSSFAAWLAGGALSHVPVQPRANVTGSSRKLREDISDAESCDSWETNSTGSFVDGDDEEDDEPNILEEDLLGGALSEPQSTPAQPPAAPRNPTPREIKHVPHPSQILALQEFNNPEDNSKECVGCTNSQSQKEGNEYEHWTIMREMFMRGILHSTETATVNSILGYYNTHVREPSKSLAAKRGDPSREKPEWPPSLILLHFTQHANDPELANVRYFVWLSRALSSTLCNGLWIPPDGCTDILQFTPQNILQCQPSLEPKQFNFLMRLIPLLEKIKPQIGAGDKGSKAASGFSLNPKALQRRRLASS